MASLRSAQLDINTVAAGGGSKLFIKNGIYVVGPESSGAHPGPVCYKKKNGALSVTDANVVLGRVIPAYFPKIFGKSESEALDRAGAEEAFATLLKNSDLGGTNPTIAEVAYGFLKVSERSEASEPRGRREYEPQHHHEKICIRLAHSLLPSPLLH